MNPEAFAKCSCQQCGNHLEFPAEAAGASIACPHCGGTTVLAAPGGSAPPATTAPELAELVNAFGGRANRARVSLWYQVGLALVALMMALLPLLYVAMVAGAAWGVFYYATHAYGALISPHGGRGRGVFSVLLYVIPLLAGALIILFLVKPLFARRAPRAQPLALNPAVELTLFKFIALICEAVGAPMPSRIDVNCQLNATAGFRRGFASLLGDDLVLTIGLPLAAGLSLQQFAGVMAHEFGHFTQSMAMRLSYIIWRVNLWFASLVYERDALDLWLDECAEEEEEGYTALVVGLAQFGVGCSRLVLQLLMHLGHAVCCFLSRQMEHDADAYQIQVAGSETFEATLRRLHVLERATARAYEALQASWVQSRRLPDNFPAFLLQQERELPLALRAKLDATMGLARAGVFHTHPSHAGRIQRARLANLPGLFQMDGPASALFANFDALARQVTLLHYTDDLRLPALTGLVGSPGHGGLRAPAARPGPDGRTG
jgi:Zn-dependent protease with chaperone function